MNLKIARMFMAVAAASMCANSALAEEKDEKWRENVAAAFAAMGVSAPDPAAVPATSSGAPNGGVAVVPEGEQVNFEYSEMVDRMEKLGKTVIGRKKKKK